MNPFIIQPTPTVTPAAPAAGSASAGNATAATAFAAAVAGFLDGATSNGTSTLPAAVPVPGVTPTVAGTTAAAPLSATPAEHAAAPSDQALALLAALVMPAAPQPPATEVATLQDGEAQDGESEGDLADTLLDNGDEAQTSEAVLLAPGAAAATALLAAMPQLQAAPPVAPQGGGTGEATGATASAELAKIVAPAPDTDITKAAEAGAQQAAGAAHARSGAVADTDGAEHARAPHLGGAETSRGSPAVDTALFGKDAGGPGRDRGDKPENGAAGLPKGHDGTPFAAAQLQAHQQAQQTDFASQLRAANMAPQQGAPAQPHAMDQITVRLHKAVSDGQDQISFHLRPVELGRIDVKLEFAADGRVKAQIAVDNPQTLELLQRDARGLERALSDAGVKTDTGSLSFSLREDPRSGFAGHEGSGENGSGRGSRGGNRGNNAEAEEAAAAQVAYARVGNGRLDVRV